MFSRERRLLEGGDRKRKYGICNFFFKRQRHLLKVNQRITERTGELI